MRVGSLISGVGGFDLGLERAGHRIVWQCEKDPYRRRVLARHWPGVPCYEDVRMVGRDDGSPTRGRNRDHPNRNGRGSPHGGVDLLCGGFPCQDLSVAGRRAGLAGERSGLFYEFARIADAVLPDGGWVLIENVPGLLSSNGGRDFAVLLATLAEFGFHDLAWRVLDSRYFGVPQRRRRVFVLARRARGRRASEVLLEPESGGGDFTKGREAREAVADGTENGAARTLKANAGNRWKGADHDTYVSHAVTTHQAKGGDPTTDNYAIGPAPDADRVRTIARLPRRAHDPIPDSPRYAACGDAVTVNVAYWIGKRLMAA